MVKKEKEVRKKMEVVQVVSQGFVETCPFCQKRLKPSNSERAAKANLRVHMSFCDKNPSNKFPERE